MKKVLSVLLALVMLLSLAACAPADGDKETTAAKNETTAAPAGDETTAPEEVAAPLFEEGAGVKIEVWAYNNKDLEMDGCYGETAIEKVTNADVTIFEYDMATLDTAMAEKKVPQVMYNNGATAIKNFGPEGAFINWFDYADDYPNIKALLEDEQWAADVAKWTNEDGTMYGLPAVATGYSSVQGYLYRGDIFEKNNLEFPTNQEEFYDTLVKLKELYPDSYPFVIRSMSGNMQGLESLGYNWGGNHELTGNFNTIFNFDHETESYYFAQTSDQMKEMISFLAKLYDEDLLHPSCMTMDTQQWTEAMASGASFITYDKVDRIPALTAAAEGGEEGWRLEGAAPIAMGSKGVAESKKQGPTNYAFTVSALLKGEELTNALKYVDWLCSEEGIVTTNWGIEGESYEVDAEGNKSWKEGFTYAGSGLGVAGVRLYQDFDAFKASYDENTQEALELISPYAVGKHDPVLTYNDEEKIIYDTYSQALFNASLAELSKFILGQRDVETEWDAYCTEMESDSYHFDELQKVHEDAYARIKE